MEGTVVICLGWMRVEYNKCRAAQTHSVLDPNGIRSSIFKSNFVSKGKRVPGILSGYVYESVFISGCYKKSSFISLHN